MADLSPTFTKLTSITINWTARTGRGAVTNFPIHLTEADFDTPEDLLDNIQSGGGGLRVISAGSSDDTEILNVEIITFDTTAQIFEFWVRVPYNINGTPRVLDIWGNNTSSQPSAFAAIGGSKAIWDDYTSVFHLGQSSGPSNDSAIAGNTGTWVNSPTSVPGKIGRAVDFEYSNSDYITVNNESDYGYSTAMTVSAWIKVESFSVDKQAIITKGDDCWRLQRAGSTNEISFICNENDTTEYIVSSEIGGSGVNDGEWHHVVGILSGDHVFLYVDGIQYSNEFPAPDLNIETESVWIGNNQNQTGRSWDGLIDEVRMSGTAISHERVEADYDFIQEKSTIITQGASTLTELGWHFKSELTLDTTSFGSAGTVTDYPIPIRILSSDISELFSGTNKCKPDGGDIRAVIHGNNGYEDILPLEIEKFVQTSGSEECLIWVKFPNDVFNIELDNTSGNEFIDLYWGRGDLTEQPDTDPLGGHLTVWDAYDSVFHMNESSSPTLDSAVLGTEGTWQGSPLPSRIDGKAGYALDFTHDNNNVVACDNESSYDYTTSMTVSVWIKVESFGYNWQAIITKGDNTWRLQRATTTNEITFVCEPVSGGAIDATSTIGGLGVNDGEWHHVVGKLEGSTISLFVDGVEYVNTNFTSPMDTTNDPVWIGNNYDQPSREWDGGIDEVRITSTALSDEWIVTEYNFFALDSLIFFGDVSEIGEDILISRGWDYSKQFWIDYTKVSCDMEYPVMITEEIDEWPSDIWTQAQSDGGDIRVVVNDEFYAPIHIIRWDVQNQKAEIMFLMDINASTYSTFNLYWGTTNHEQQFVVDSTYGQYYVYKGDIPYSAVWHLSETSGTIGYDSTEGQLHGTYIGETSLPDFQYGDTLTSHKFTDNGLLMPNSPLFEMTAGMDFVIEFLGVTIDTLASVYGDTMQLVDCESSGGGFGQYDFFVNDSNDKIGYHIYDDSSSTTIYSDSAVVADGTKYNLMFRRSSAGLMTMYVNGVLQADTDTVAGSLTRGDNLFSVGRDYYHPDEFFKGNIEQIRVTQNNQKDECYINTLQNNLEDISTFIIGTDPYTHYGSISVSRKVSLNALDKIRVQVKYKNTSGTILTAEHSVRLLITKYFQQDT